MKLIQNISTHTNKNTYNIIKNTIQHHTTLQKNHCKCQIIQYYIISYYSIYTIYSNDTIHNNKYLIRKIKYVIQMTGCKKEKKSGILSKIAEKIDKKLEKKSKETCCSSCSGSCC